MNQILSKDAEQWYKKIVVPCMHGLHFKTTKINSKFVQKKNHKITYLLFLIQRYTVTNSDGPQVTGFWLLKKKCKS